MHLSDTARSYVLLAVGLAVVSSAPILIRLAQAGGMPSLVIAAGRMSIAAAILTPIALRGHRRELQSLRTTDWVLCVTSGAFLGLHFATFITSLEYTSVLASNVLVTTNPLFVAILSMPLLRERVSRPVALGIGLAFLGSAVVALGGNGGHPPTRSAPLLGSSLALAGALAMSLYLIIGRKVRAKLSVFPYIWLVYGSASLALVAAVTLRGAPVLGHPLRTYVWVTLLAIGPQLVGHSTFNYVLAYMPAARVGLGTLVVPIGSATLAALILGEQPSVWTLAGAFLILAGVALGNVASDSRRGEGSRAPGSRAARIPETDSG